MKTPQSAKLGVGPSIEASVLMVDVRNFTSNLSNCTDSPRGRNAFCQFLSRFYDCCVQSCVAGCASNSVDALYINSTGDGALCVFLDPERHYLDCYLSSLVLANGVAKLCESFNRTKPKKIPNVSFGIGIDSGSVRRVGSATWVTGTAAIETYIGNCINIAARIEAVTKDHERTTVLISSNTNDLLCRRLFKMDYAGLMERAISLQEQSDRKELWGIMNELNESLLLTFLHSHNLRGVSKPMALFRVSPTLAVAGKKEFQDLLESLCVNHAQLSNVCQMMNPSAGYA